MKCELEGKGIKASEEMTRKWYKLLTGVDGIKILRLQMILRTTKTGGGKEGEGKRRGIFRGNNKVQQKRKTQ